MEVKLPHWGLADPLSALICLQRTWTRANRSLIGALRSASNRSVRARCSSSTLPLSVLSAMTAV
jgi:hypothetical protein